VSLYRSALKCSSSTEKETNLTQDKSPVTTPTAVLWKLDPFGQFKTSFRKFEFSTIVCFSTRAQRSFLLNVEPQMTELKPSGT